METVKTGNVGLANGLAAVISSGPTSDTERCYAMVLSYGGVTGYTIYANEFTHDLHAGEVLAQRVLREEEAYAG